MAAKKASDNQFIGFWYTRLHMYMLLNKSSRYFPPLCRGGPPGTKCPLQISELVSIYNYALEALALSDRDLRNPSYEFWDRKSALLKEKYFAFFEKHPERMKNVVPEHRIVPIPRDVCTKRIVLGFILK